MAKSLVIVESPAKAKTINKFLGPDFVVKPTGGHIVDLPQKELGVDIDNNFEPTYGIIRGKNKVLQELKAAAKKVDYVYLATDPDREGEAIAWHVAERIIGKNQTSYRVLFNQITKDAVRKAVSEKGELDMKKVNAQQARRVLDRIVGFKVSPLLWKTIYRGLSAGRVQSVALRMIVERDAEIDAFTPEEYWNIKALLLSKEKETFEAKLLKKNNKAIQITSGEEADKVVGDLKSSPFIVKDVTEKKTKSHPAPPFITSTLQQEAARRLGFTVSRTMRVAQSLYEGIDLDDGLTGLITYMRTDSTRVAPEALDEVRQIIADKWGKENVPAKPNYYKTKKGAQDAHEAIRPASLDHSPDAVGKYLDKDQSRLYRLIWNKFLASQMKPAEFTVITVDISAGDYILRSTSKHLDYDGYLAAYANIKDEDDEPELTSLPDFTSGDELSLNEILSSQHFTKPPAHFSEAMLVKELEACGIGRPSTYAQIINTIQTRNYVERDKGKLLATDLGKSVNTILVSGFNDLFNTDFTAKLEEELDKVESGEYEWKDVVKEFYGPFNDSLEKLMSKTKELKESLIERTEESCEKCGEPMIIRWGRNGKFMACSGFPGCKNTKPLEETEQIISDEKCDICGSGMEVKNGRFGRFLACSNYPDCKNIKPFSLGVKCPEEGCDGQILEKKSKKGRLFYGCSRYPDCKFASWTQPVAEKCPDCASPSLVISKNGESYSCPRCKNKFTAEEIVKTDLA